MEINNIKDLEEKTKKIRELSIRTIYKVASGHIGPALSIAEMVSTLLFSQMNWKQYFDEVKTKDKEEQLKFWHDPEMKRDRFILSKGHAVPAWYVATVVAGLVDEKELEEFRKMGSRLQGHPERQKFPFIDSTTGSLGQGQSEALGYALAKKAAGRDEMVYCIIGDGESNEGQVWETAMSAPKFKLDNLVILVDFNKKQGEGDNKDIMDIEPLDKKWEAFNWHVQRIDGHDIKALLAAFDEIKETKGKPHVIICDTIKGYLGDGELFMDGKHNPVIDDENYNKAKEFLGV